MSIAGVMRGAGRQLLASILNLITYWGLGLPLAILLGVYFKLGVEGLWWALLITTSVQVTFSSALLPYIPLDRQECPREHTMQVFASSNIVQAFPSGSPDTSLRLHRFL